jgi:hypothetical protein
MPTGHSPSMPGAQDPAETVARVVVEKRHVLLRAYRGWLRPHDLEDCLSQAALELVVRGEAGRERLPKLRTHRKRARAEAPLAHLRSAACNVRQERDPDGARTRVAA